MASFGIAQEGHKEHFCFWVGRHYTQLLQFLKVGEHDGVWS